MTDGTEHMEDVRDSRSKWRGTTALISEWMVREGFLEEVTAEQAALGQSECPYLHFTIWDEISM